MGGRGHGSGWGGRGEWNSVHKRPSDELEDDDDIQDTESSPLKNTGEDMDEDGVRFVEGSKTSKKLTFEEEEGTTEKEKDNSSSGLTPPPPPGYIPPRDKKRFKKSGDGGNSTSNESLSAAPLEGDRREQ